MLGRSGIPKIGHIIDCLYTEAGTGDTTAAPHQNEWRAGQADHHPHDGADQQVVAPPPPTGSERVEQEDTPLHADTHLETENMT